MAKPTPPTPSPRRPPFYVPHRFNPLLRHYKSWLQQIEEALHSGAAVVKQVDYSRGVALHGYGGLGKTAMAVAYAHQRQGSYPGGVFWVQADLGLGQALSELAKGLGWDITGVDDQQIIAAVLARLRTRELKLVILDNLEDKVAPEEIVTLPASQLLITTRLSEVSEGEPVSMGLPTEEEALGIFLAYAELEGRELSDEEKKAAYAVCQRAGLLPVALEILGKTARKVALVELAGQLGPVVQREALVGSKRQVASVAACLRVTEHQFSHPRAKDALLYLSYLFPEELDQQVLALVMFAGMGEDAPQDPLAEAQKMLSALAEFSVVQPKPDGGYAMHRLVQEAARLKDEGQKVGERVVAVLDAIIRAISEAGNYQAGYALIPHLMHIAELSAPELGLDALPNIYILNRFAEFLWRSGRHQTSDGVYEKVQARIAAVKGKAHPDYATLLNNRATQLEGQGKYTEAEKLYRQAIKIDEKTIGKEHPTYAIALSNLAGVLEEQGKYTEAEKLYRQAMEIDEKTIGKEHPGYATDLNNLAGVLEDQGKYPEAEKLYRQAIGIGEKTIGKEHPGYAIDLNNPGRGAAGPGQIHRGREALPPGHRDRRKDHRQGAPRLRHPPQQPGRGAGGAGPVGRGGGVVCAKQ